VVELVAVVAVEADLLAALADHLIWVAVELNKMLGVIMEAEVAQETFLVGLAVLVVVVL
jgi:hypothetical protein